MRPIIQDSYSVISCCSFTAYDLRRTCKHLSNILPSSTGVGSNIYDVVVHLSNCFAPRNCNMQLDWK